MIFDSQNMSEDDLKANREHRQQFTELWKKLSKELPDNRYTALVKTKLEEAQMFATKALSHKEII